MNNLALEYMAQATGFIEAAVADIKFDSSLDMKKRTKELTERLGIGPQKAFPVLSAAVGCAQLAGGHTPTSAAATGPGDDEVYLHLVENPKDRFEAVARRDWKYDLGLLREIISSDPQALAAVRQEIDKQGLLESLVLRISKAFSSDTYEGEVGPEGINYYKLASRPELLQKALAARKWQQSPELARRVLGLNPYEAASLRSQDLAKATGMLWDKYHPYRVWYYLGVVGLLGTIGMVVFYFATGKPKQAGEA